jgi:plastocyanin
VAFDDAAVKIDNFTFTSKSVALKAGTTVTWTNQDDIPRAVMIRPR